MIACDIQPHLYKRVVLKALVDGHQRLVTDLDMRLHDRELLRRELAGFEQNQVGDTDLADIVQGTRAKDRGDILVVDHVAILRQHSCLFREQAAIACRALNMRAGLIVPRFRELDQRENRRHLGFGNLLDLVRDHLFEVLIIPLQLLLRALDLRDILHGAVAAKRFPRLVKLRLQANMHPDDFAASEAQAHLRIPRYSLRHEPHIALMDKRQVLRHDKRFKQLT